MCGICGFIYFSDYPADNQLLISLAKSIGVENETIFAGKRNDIPNIMKALDVFVLPSLWEGFGLVPLEAMAAQKPVVATSVSAIPEVIVDGETGLLIPPKDSIALADAILKLLDDPELAREMGRKGRVRLEKEFSVDRMVSQTEALYDRLILSKSYGACWQKKCSSIL